jgi:hypothetical protein
MYHFLSEKGLFRVILSTFAFILSTCIATTAQIKTAWNVTSSQTGNWTSITWTKTAITGPATTATYPGQNPGESDSVHFSSNVTATITLDTDIEFFGCILRTNGLINILVGNKTLKVKKLEAGNATATSGRIFSDNVNFGINGGTGTVDVGGNFDIRSFSPGTGTVIMRMEGQNFGFASPSAPRGDRFSVIREGVYHNLIIEGGNGLSPRPLTSLLNSLTVGGNSPTGTGSGLAFFRVRVLGGIALPLIISNSLTIKSGAIFDTRLVAIRLNSPTATFSMENDAILMYGRSSGLSVDTTDSVFELANGALKSNINLNLPNTGFIVSETNNCLLSAGQSSLSLLPQVGATFKYYGATRVMQHNKPLTVTHALIGGIHEAQPGNFRLQAPLTLAGNINIYQRNTAGASRLFVPANNNYFGPFDPLEPTCLQFVGIQPYPPSFAEPGYPFLTDHDVILPTNGTVNLHVTNARGAGINLGNYIPRVNKPGLVYNVSFNFVGNTGLNDVVFPTQNYGTTANAPGCIAFVSTNPNLRSNLAYISGTVLFNGSRLQIGNNDFVNPATPPHAITFAGPIEVNAGGLFGNILPTGAFNLSIINTASFTNFIAVPNINLDNFTLDRANAVLNTGTGTTTFNNLNVIRGTINLNNTAGAITSVSGNLNKTATGTLNGALNNTLRFTGSSNQTITLTGTVNNINIGNITVNKSGGTVNLASGLIRLLNNMNLPNTNAGTFNVSAGAGFIFESTPSGTASLLEVGGGTLTGDYTVRRYINKTNSWNFIATPVLGQTWASWHDNFPVTNLTPAPFSNGLGNLSAFSYDGTLPTTSYEPPPSSITNGWIAPTSATLTVGEGYRVWIRRSIENQPHFGAFDNKGAINIGTTNRPLTYNAAGWDGGGWNFLGNPYPATLDWNLVHSGNNFLNSSVYIWNSTNLSYEFYTAPSGPGGARRYIASGQAFMVKTPAANTMTFTETMKTSAFNNTFIREAVELTLPYFGIKVTNPEEYYDETFIWDNKNATVEYDPQYDADKLPSTFISLYTTTPTGKQLASNAFNIQELSIIPLHFRAELAGTHRFTFSNVGAMGNAEIYLRDNLLNTLTKLNDNAEYIFDVNQSSYFTDDRFEIIFSPEHLVANGVNINHQLLVYPNPVEASDVQINISGAQEGNYNISISDVMGRTVTEASMRISGNTIFKPAHHLAQGVYWLTLSRNNSTSVHKLIVR